MKTKPTTACAPTRRPAPANPQNSSATGTPAKARPSRAVVDVRLELDAARARIDLEIERRQRAEQEVQRHLVTERERVRKQLHDGLGQVLTSISFLANTLRARLATHGITDSAELEEIVTLINKAIAESRAIAAGCDPQPRAAATM